MRPRRLEISGFTSFKEQTEVDLNGSDFFALVGATGSGKSSIIDAMCFALYGSVPRYDNRNLVAPVISHGKVEAKVLLEFSIEGKEYTAVRVVRRSGKGATTKEARLEAGGEVLAGNADELTERVTDLVGLSFEHFTRCVVLPQGEFARFLHDKPGERQDLVVKLLNLGIYDRMRQSASARATEKKIELDRAQHRLSSELAFATPEALSEAKARAKRLQELRKRVGAAKPQLDEAQASATEARSKAQECLGWFRLAAALEVPSGIDELGERLQRATESAANCDEDVAAARKEVEAAIAARKKQSDPAPLNRALAAHDRRDKLVAAEKPALDSLESSERDLEASATVLAEAEQAVPVAEEAKKTLERAHAAQHVAAHLEAGASCPVCLQPVTKMPKHPQVPGLEQAETALGEARRVLAGARKTNDKVTAAHARAESEVAGLRRQLAEVADELKGFGERPQIEKQLAAIGAAEDALEEARRAEDRARKDLDRARKDVESIRQKETKARNAFESARDRVAALTPPPAERQSLVEDWRVLAEWGHQRADELKREAAALEEAAVRAEEQREALIDQLLDACTECELEVGRNEDPLEAVVEAQTEAKGEIAEISAAIEEAKSLRRATKTLEIDQKTAEEVALHLSARAGRFESWLVNAALRRLVEGATSILDQLSNGQYALTIDDAGAFQVVDRHNADETRSAKTLSGGETFLASLALALALADQLADLASDGAASLEAIFLDEGFGTLDPETLDTVAATVENLAEDGRMVGIVTHVRELAERVPVQYRVKKDLRTSTVERVVA